MTEYRNTPLTDQEDKEIAGRMSMGICIKEDFERMVDSPNSKCPEGTSQSRDLMCLYWFQNTRQPAYLLMEDQQQFKHQMKMWRKLAVEGCINILSCNCKTETYKGRNYYGICIQAHNPATGELEEAHDPLSLMLFGFMCSGITYWMTAKTNRDRIVKYVMKDIDENRFHDK